MATPKDRRTLEASARRVGLEDRLYVQLFRWSGGREPGTPPQPRSQPDGGSDERDRARQPMMALTPRRLAGLALFAAALLAPAPWGVLALAAALAGRGVVAVGRFARNRRTRRADPGTIVLGRDHAGRQVALSDRQLEAHALIVGASGAGKTTTLQTILAQQIARGRPVVAIDMKGSPAFASELAAAASAAGRRLTVWRPDGPTHWNPLAHGGPTALKDRLMSAERFSEPHYQRAAERYLQTALTVLAAVHPDRPPSLERGRRRDGAAAAGVAWRDARRGRWRAARPITWPR